MAFNVASDARIVLSAENRTDAAFSAAQRNVDSLSQGASSLISRYGGVAGAVTLAAGAFTKFLSETIDAQNEQAQLEAVLRSTGMAAGFAASELNLLAEQLSNKSVFAAGEITNAQTRLLSYTGIVGRQFPAAMQITIDMAQRMGMSVEQSAELIGRALDIPSQGLTALTRQGFRFTESQKELIKSLEDTGRVAEAQDIIIKTLEGSYGGAAEAARNTLGGALKALANSFNDLFEASAQSTGELVQWTDALNRLIQKREEYSLLDKVGFAISPVGMVALERYFPSTPNGGIQNEQSGKIGRFDFDAARKLSEKKAEIFKQANPFKDDLAKLQAYQTKLQEVNILEQNGGLTVQEATRYRQQLNAEYEKSTTKSTALSESKKAMLAYYERVNQEIVKQNVARAEEIRAEDAYIASQQNLQTGILQDILNRTEATQNEINEYGLLESQIAATALARAEEKRIVLENLGLTTDDINKEIEARKQLVNVTLNKERLDAEKKAADEAVRIWQQAEEQKRREFERSVDGINETFRFSFSQLINGGEGSWKAFMQSLNTTFKTTVADQLYRYFAQPFVVKLIASVAGITGLGDIKSVSQLLNGTGGAGSGTTAGGLLQEVGNIFTKSNQVVYDGIASFGKLISGDLSGIRGAIGGFIQQNATTIGNLASYGGAVLQLAQGNFAGAAGTALGTFFGGPVGGAIGSFLGSAIGGLFGGKSYKRFGTTVSGFQGAGSEYAQTAQGIIYDRSLGGGDALNDINKQFSNTLQGLLGAFGESANIGTYSGLYQRGKSKKSGGIFGATVDGVDIGRIDVVLKKASMDAVYQALVNKVFGEGLVRAIKASPLDVAIKDLFTGLTGREEVATLVNDVMRLGQSSEVLSQSFDITVSQVALLAKETGIAGENFTKLTDILLGAANEALTIGDAMVNLKGDIMEAIGIALPNSLKAYDQALRDVNTTTAEGRAEFLKLLDSRNAFKQFDGLLVGLQNNVRTGLYSLVSDAEKRAMQQEDLAKMFAEFGLAVPKNAQEFIKLGKEIDFNDITKEGLNLANAFPNLVAGFIEVNGAVQALTNTLNPDRFKTFNDFIKASSFARNGIALNMLPAANMPAFADGGYHSGGLRLVGERGPEIEATGASRIYSAEQTKRMLSGDGGSNNASLVAEVRRLNRTVDKLSTQLADVVQFTERTAKSTANIENGDAILTVEAA